MASEFQGAGLGDEAAALLQQADELDAAAAAAARPVDDVVDDGLRQRAREAGKQLGDAAAAVRSADDILEEFGNDAAALTRLAKEADDATAARLNRRAIELIDEASEGRQASQALRRLATEFEAAGLDDEAAMLLQRASQLDEAAGAGASRAGDDAVRSVDDVDPAASRRSGPRVPPEQVRVSTVRPIDSFAEGARDAVHGTREIIEQVQGSNSSFQNFLRLGGREAPDQLTEASALASARRQLDRYLREAGLAADDAAVAEVRAAMHAVDSRIQQISVGMADEMVRELDTLSNFRNSNPPGPRRWLGLGPAGRPDPNNAQLAHFNRAFEVSDEIARIQRVRSQIAGVADDVAMQRVDDALTRAAQRLDDQFDNLVEATAQQPGHQRNLAGMLRNADDMAQSNIPEVAEIGRRMVQQIERSVPEARQLLQRGQDVLTGLTNEIEMAHVLLARARVGEASSRDALRGLIRLYGEIDHRSRILWGSVPTGRIDYVIPRRAIVGLIGRGNQYARALRDAEIALASAVRQLPDSEVIQLARIMRRNASLGDGLRAAVNRRLRDIAAQPGGRWSRAELAPVRRTWPNDAARRAGIAFRYALIADGVLWASNNVLWGMERIPKADGSRRHVDSVSERVGDFIEDTTPFSDFGRWIENGDGSFIIGPRLGNPGRITY